MKFLSKAVLKFFKVKVFKVLNSFLGMKDKLKSGWEGAKAGLRIAYSLTAIKNSSVHAFSGEIRKSKTFQGDCLFSQAVA